MVSALLYYTISSTKWSLFSSFVTTQCMCFKDLDLYLARSVHNTTRYTCIEYCKMKSYIQQNLLHPAHYNSMTKKIRASRVSIMVMFLTGVEEPRKQYSCEDKRHLLKKIWSHKGLCKITAPFTQGIICQKNGYL